MTEDLAVGNCAEDDRVVDEDIVDGQDSGAGLSGIGDPANGLRAE